MFDLWRQSLDHLNTWFLDKRATAPFFFPKLFLFFVLLNFSCYWFALLSAYPEHLTSYKSSEYILLSFPVALMGAVFDSLSLFLTLELIRCALNSKSNLVYVALLSIDIPIAAIAALWVLFAFVFSGWLVALFLSHSETLSSRAELYEGRVWNAAKSPFSTENIRNIFFGIVMGASALLPTIIHLLFALKSSLKFAAFGSPGTKND